MYCSECGAKNEENAKECYSCNHIFEVEKKSKPNMVFKINKRILKLASIGLIAIVLIFGVGSRLSSGYSSVVYR